jgi:hypothetical protein
MKGGRHGTEVSCKTRNDWGMILTIRGQRVMLDRALAELYGVETKYLNRQVKRNRRRFPEQFMFQLTKKETKELVTNWHRFEPLKHSSTTPFAFTEHGVEAIQELITPPEPPPKRRIGFVIEEPGVKYTITRKRR